MLTRQMSKQTKKRARPSPSSSSLSSRHCGVAGRARLLLPAAPLSPSRDRPADFGPPRENRRLRDFPCLLLSRARVSTYLGERTRRGPKRDVPSAALSPPFYRPCQSRPRERRPDCHICAGGRGEAGGRRRDVVGVGRDAR